MIEWLASLSILLSTSSNASECFFITGNLQIRDNGFNNSDFKETDGVVGDAEKFPVSGTKDYSFVEDDLVIIENDPNNT